ncbi:MBL fold metallo-hydrolase [Pseudoroseomonas ludipueritiae]|uniref:Metallo-beta-lactamase domain-containing protein n=1 Tax=Pseudoroseomonas ludipueritiae TaxID=198093 RepID=A0ABR7R3D4_9PROT|nr:MBL fold metallo-hydrolase [Pseudoroseomonas ludipueritiae]MBC9176162.1 hypothetical protein [Pseudoroseomonas ludipueritiae]
MPSTFYALPLERRGESFLLRTNALDETSILVDTGYEVNGQNQKTLASVIKTSAPATTKINRLIITHEDADHCQGAPQFIAEWKGLGHSIDQVWLPALWLIGAGSAVRKDWNISRIVEGAFEAAPEIAKLVAKMQRSDTEQAGDAGYPDQAEAWLRPFRHPDAEAATAQRVSTMLDEVFRPAEQDETDGRIPQLERAADGSGRDEATLSRMFKCHRRMRSTGVCVACAMLEAVGPEAIKARHGLLAHSLAEIAIQTHASIAPVVAACQANAIPVRWFDYLRFASTMTPGGGDRGFLTPVNAVELVPTGLKPSARAMFFALYLTRANRESLVYLRHQSSGEPAVLFAADSRLKAGQKPFKPPAGLPSPDRLLATAPHHGSSSNAAAYQVLKSWLSPHYPPILVQNGGHRVTSSAPEFQAISDRLCVRCIGSSGPPQLVKVDAPHGTWNVPRPRAACTCT